MLQELRRRAAEKRGEANPSTKPTVVTKVKAKAKKKKKKNNNKVRAERTRHLCHRF